MKRAWAILAAVAAAAVIADGVALRPAGRPLIERRTCDESQTSHTVALDMSPRGDVLYRFVYTTLFGLGDHAPRPGFPHVEMAPACTLGWKDPVAAIRIGSHIFLVTFDGARIVSVKDTGE